MIISNLNKQYYIPWNAESHEYWKLMQAQAEHGKVYAQLKLKSKRPEIKTTHFNLTLKIKLNPTTYVFINYTPFHNQGLRF